MCNEFHEGSLHGTSLRTSNVQLLSMSSPIPSVTAINAVDHSITKDIDQSVAALPYPDQPGLNESMLLRSSRADASTEMGGFCVSM